MTRPEVADKAATYAGAGVDIDAGERVVDLIRPAIAATRRPGADGEIGGFGGLFDLSAAGFADPVLVAATDGVGTKLRIAIETGVLDTIGIDLVAMCVNDLVVQGAEPLFFLDYFATGRLSPDAAAAVINGVAKGCGIAGAALVGGETAEMPGFYAPSDFDLAGFAVGAVERDRRLPRPEIREKDVLLGLAASGAHSNGFSLVRQLIADAGLELASPAPFDPTMDLGRSLLTPTRIYVRPLLAALRATSGIKALAHITGGGLTDNVPRALPARLAAAIRLDTLPIPPILRWMRRAGRMSDAEFLRTFNAGIGMVAIAEPGAAHDIAAHLQEAGETVHTIGELVETNGGPRVRYTGELAA